MKPGVDGATRSELMAALAAGLGPTGHCPGAAAAGKARPCDTTDGGLPRRGRRHRHPAPALPDRAAPWPTAAGTASTRSTRKPTDTQSPPKAPLTGRTDRKRCASRRQRRARARNSGRSGRYRVDVLEPSWPSWTRRWPASPASAPWRTCSAGRIRGGTQIGQIHAQPARPHQWPPGRAAGRSATGSWMSFSSTRVTSTPRPAHRASRSRSPTPAARPPPNRPRSRSRPGR